jgi:hypothetical protein
MGWEERLIESAYTTPSGNRLLFIYEDVGYEFDKKGTSFDFPSTNGSYIQQLGNSSRRYPMICFFWGDNCDTESENFIKGLEEEGIGKLEHPIYGIIDALPLGTIKRRDDLKTASNQSIIEVVFFNTIGAIYPDSDNSLSSDVISTVEEYKNKASDSFGENIDLSSETKIITLKNKVLSYVSKINTSLKPLISTIGDINTFFTVTSDSITGGIDEILKTPTTLALQTIDLIHAPAKAFISITDKINSYKILSNDLLYDASNALKISKSKNDYIADKLFIETYSTATVLSVINNEFETKNEALLIAESILSQLDTLNEWNDLQLDTLNEIDTGESYQKLQESIALTAGYLVQISFTLKQERSIVLDRNRTILDLCFELYGEVDEQLDFLINSNNLNGSEILELQKGKEIVYYV